MVKSVTTVYFYFGWLVATPAASQQHKKIFFLATSTLLQVPVPVPVPVVQVPVQVPVPNLQVTVPVPGVRNLEVPVPVQVLCINDRHSVTLQLYKVKVVVSFILKTRCLAIAERPRCRVRYSFRQK